MVNGSIEEAINIRVTNFFKLSIELLEKFKITYVLNLNFESKKLLNILQVAGAMSGNANLQTITDLSKNYDGVRLGFEMYK